MRGAARLRRPWRALAILAVPGALLATSTVQAAPPPTDPPPETAPAETAPPVTAPPDTATAGSAPAEPAPETTPAPPPGELQEVPSELAPIDQINGSKAPTSQAAESDPELLGRTDATPVALMVKLDYDSVATYAGTIEGLDATSPSVTGRELNTRSSAERSYEQYIVSEEQAFAADLAAAVPEATIGESLRIVYGGLRTTLPANRIDDLLAIPNVVAVQQDKLEQLQTDHSGEFIGATTLYPQMGGTARAGSGVIFGVLDSGVWPEHASFAQTATMGLPPRRFDGLPRPCNFGDNPLTPATDVFRCNNKLIAGQNFLNTYRSVVTTPPEVYPTTARDSNGHGTHTGTTAAGNALTSAPLLGVDRGPLAGIAPGAWVAAYKVCGALGCYSSDAAAAVQQAILDGVDVINFSISGGQNPATDVVELAFLDAYAAGVFVAASAGNSGPGPSTTDHLSPWTTTVAASSQDRQFASTLTITGTDGATVSYVGSSITAGIGQTPVVFPQPNPTTGAADPLCLTQQPAGTYTGVIVACQRGPNRVLKGYSVYTAGAAGMILYNVTRPQTEMTDNHWLPTVHIDEGDEMLAWVTTHGIAGATFTAGVATESQGDVMADFSSRGPGGNFIKPDITAPGLQILAGNTPTPESSTLGPPGNYFQSIAGTSMSSPHIAGSATLLKSLHPTWTPGQIKSALMTTAVTDVVKEDGVTQGDWFDFGGGRVDLTKAGSPGVTFDVAAADMYSIGTDPLAAVNLNLPSINVPVLPGRVETTRTAVNVASRRVRYTVETTAPAGSSIEVSPPRLNLAAGQSGTLEITISSTLEDAKQYFGEIRLVSQTAGIPDLHMPVAFMPQDSSVTLSSTCVPDEVIRTLETTCTITAQNQSFNPTEVDLTTSVDRYLRIVGAAGASVTRDLAILLDAPLAGVVDALPSIDPDAEAGYEPLSGFPATIVAPLGDESIVNFNVPTFTYAAKTYSRIGIDSNGYIVVGGGATPQDNDCCAPAIPDPARPNNVLAPYWTDLNGTGRAGALVNVLTDGTDDWIVVEWQVNLFGTTQLRTFQTWIGVNGTEDIRFAYPTGADMSVPAGYALLVGAENASGTGGDSLGANVVPTGGLRVTSANPLPGGSVSYDVFVRGQRVGLGTVTTEMDTPAVLGTTIETSTVNVVPN